MTRRLSRTSALASGLLIVFLTLVVPCAAAAESPAGDSPAAQAPATDANIGAAPGAMFAFRDPETGEMRHHTPAELEDVGHRLIHIFADGFEAGDTSAWTAAVP